MNVRFHHRRVEAHLAPLYHLVLLGDLHYALVNLFDTFRPERQAPAPHGLSVGRLAGSHPREIAVHQIGPDFAFQHLVAPVADGLQCLAQENVHDAPGGGIVVRPWGERSFYAEDPWKNPLCFVEDGTVYKG